MIAFFVTVNELLNLKNSEIFWGHFVTNTQHTPLIRKKDNSKKHEFRDITTNTFQTFIKNSLTYLLVQFRTNLLHFKSVIAKM